MPAPPPKEKGGHLHLRSRNKAPLIPPQRCGCLQFSWDKGLWQVISGKDGRREKIGGGKVGRALKMEVLGTKRVIRRNSEHSLISIQDPQGNEQGGWGGTGLDNDYGIKGVVWHLPHPAHPSQPYHLYQNHYKGILPGPPTFPGSPPPPSGTSLQLTLPTTGSSASPSTSLHILKGAYQVPGPGLSPAIMPGW